MRWPWSRKQEPRALTSISDPLIARWLNPGGFVDLAGVHVGEHSALGLSAVYRAVSLIAGTLASLPLRSLRDDGSGMRQQVPSVFDDPDGPDGQTKYEWTETLFIHLLLHGRAHALKLTNEAGSLARLPLVHPYCVTLRYPTPEDYQTGNVPVGGVWFDVRLNDGTQVTLDQTEMFYVPGPSLDGRCGLGLLQLARLAMGTGIAADRAAAAMFSKGALISGMVTPADASYDLIDDVPEIRRQLDLNVTGHENAGGIAILNRALTFAPWTMSNVDAQFLESRSFQIEEIARFTGVPPHLLMSSEKSTSWGTGLEEQNRALGRNVLAPWGARLEQRGSRLLARPRFIEFDFAGLERPSPDVEIGLLIQQVAAGLLTLNEARAIRNLPPLPEPAPAPEPPENDEETDDEPAQ